MSSKNKIKDEYTKNNNRNNYNEHNKLHNDNQGKLPLKSVAGRRCLTKCYPKYDTFLHPVSLAPLTNRGNDGCAVYPVYSKDPNYQSFHDMIFVDNCRLEDNNTFQPPDEIESILLSFYFNASDFLANIYDLHSFDQVIYWTVENDYMPFDTIKRVHNCAWKVFGNRIEELSSGVVDYYYDICINYWLIDYAKIIINEYSFDLISDKPTSEITDNINETRDIILKNFMSYNFFLKTLHGFVYEYQDKWEMIDSHYDFIKKYVFSQLVEEIETIKPKKV